jgi:hypothetical protein
VRGPAKEFAHSTADKLFCRIWQRISGPAERTHVNVVGDMQRCELRKLVETPTSLDPGVRKRTLDCFTALGYTVSDASLETPDGSGRPSPVKP